MRVAFVDQAGAKPGGAEESLTLLLKHLPADIEPSVVFFEDGEFAQRMRDSGYRTTIAPMPDYLRAVPRERPSSTAIAGMPGAIASLTRVLGSLKVDIVHTNTVKAHLIAGPAARLRGLRTVMHLRDMVEGTSRVALRSIALTCSKERIAISRALATWYAMPNTTIISNPVELSAYDQMPDKAASRERLGIPLDDVPLIGIVGRINRWKGHDRFLRIVAAVNASYPVRCAIIGEARFRDADFVPELHALAAELGIADRTTFVPWLDDPRVAYAALDIHCNCSEREPFGRSIVEAAAAGLPTVAFDDGGAADIIRDDVDGRLIPAGNDEEFARAVSDFARDSLRRRLAGEAARAGSGRFAAAAHAVNVARILRRCAA
jgi:glycosyltransferase involved in cell wall biosynthesis